MNALRSNMNSLSIRTEELKFESHVKKCVFMLSRLPEINLNTIWIEKENPIWAWFVNLREFYGKANQCSTLFADIRKWQRHRAVKGWAGTSTLFSVFLSAFCSSGFYLSITLQLVSNWQWCCGNFLSVLLPLSVWVLDRQWQRLVGEYEQRKKTPGKSGRHKF